MTDVRLTATTPEGEVVPVLSNSKGELLLEAPIAPPEFDGNLDGDLTVSGSATFAGDVEFSSKNKATFGGVVSGAQFRCDSDFGNAILGGSSSYALIVKDSSDRSKVLIGLDGSGDFSGEMTIASKGTKWLIRESNGVAMLIGATMRGDVEPPLKEVRDLPRELDLVEAALDEIMGKLRMTPPAGWPVWDGSDNSQ